MEQQPRRRRKLIKSNVLTGLLFLLIGGVLLLQQSGYELPHWLFNWKMMIIIVAVFIGIRKGIRDLTWLVIALVGFAFLSSDIWPELGLRQYLLPAMFIIFGLFFLVAPKRFGLRRCTHTTRHPRFRGAFRAEFRAGAGPAQPEYEPGYSPVVHQEPNPTNDAYVDIVSICAGVKKKILSKQFTGGEIVCIFGGTELNLTNADFNSPIVLDLVQIFGGTKLVVPANWEVRTEAAAIFGGIDDKRHQPPNTISDKVMILKGTIIFGGVEINSY